MTPRRTVTLTADHSTFSGTFVEFTPDRQMVVDVDLTGVSYYPMREHATQIESGDGTVLDCVLKKVESPSLNSPDHLAAVTQHRLTYQVLGEVEK